MSRFKRLIAETRRRVSSALRCLLLDERDASEQRFRRIFEHSNDAIFLIDPRTDRILAANQRACRVLGYSHSELMALPVSAVHPDEMPKLLEFANSVFEVGHGSTHELTCLTKSGDKLSAEISASTIEYGGTIAICASVRDVTARCRAEREAREANELVRLMMDSTGEGIYGTDLDGNVTFANPACAKLLGFETTTELLGKNMHELAHHTRPNGDPYPVEECRIYQSFRDQRGTHVDDEVMFRVDGSSFPAEYWSHPVERAGERVGCVVTFVDITERQQAQRKLERYSQELERRVAQRTERLQQSLDEIQRLKQRLEHENETLREEVAVAREIGSYELVERIGQGGMGEVWVAKHRMLARPAAIKLIRAEIRGEDGTPTADTVEQRFEREAQSTATLQSPHTVEVYDFGITSDGAFYYVMELLDGLDLGALVARFGPIPASRAVHLLRQVCHSLGEAHERCLIHRDIKPENILVCHHGPDYDFVKVLDFGLVGLRPEARGQRGDITVDGVAAGTPMFMAPEQARGRGDIDGRVDIYSVGCVAYWLLTGSNVFDGDSAVDLIVQHVSTPPIAPSQRSELEIPEALDRVILKCLEKNPDDRPQTAWELEALLGSVVRADDWNSVSAREWWNLHQPVARRSTECKGLRDGPQSILVATRPFDREGRAG